MANVFAVETDGSRTSRKHRVSFGFAHTCSGKDEEASQALVSLGSRQVEFLLPIPQGGQLRLLPSMESNQRMDELRFPARRSMSGTPDGRHAGSPHGH